MSGLISFLGAAGGCLALAATAGAGAAATPVARAVAVTFDDLPCNPVECPDAARQVAVNRRIVAVLQERSIPALGFVNAIRVEEQGEVRPERVAALEVWLDAGLELGNHSYSHPSLHRTPLVDWLADVERGEALLRVLLSKRERSLEWFRHPFLQTGRDLATKRAAEAFLHERGVRVAPVTIDNAEWIFARAYLEADVKGDVGSRTSVADAYVAYMEAKTDYYERQSVALFGREIPQVLLVHGNRLNADHFERVATMLEKRGYRFVRLSRALEDDAYRSADTFTGPAGITWLHRWALSREPRGRIVEDEPRTPAWVMELAGVEGE